VIYPIGDPGTANAGSPCQIGASFAQPYEVSTLPERRYDSILRQEDPIARVEW